MATLRGFGRRIRDTGAAVESNATKLVRAVAVAVDRTVVLATPVDTGRARANWQVAVGGPAGGTVDVGDSPAANTQAAIAAGAATIATAQQGQTIHITNNLPYIGRLNDGYSAQAPAGFVELAVLAGVEEAARNSLLK